MTTNRVATNVDSAFEVIKEEIATADKATIETFLDGFIDDKTD